METIILSPSGAFTMPAEIQDWEMEQLPDKGTTNCRYLRLGRQTGERMTALARPRIPAGWKQIRLVSIDRVLYLEFERVEPPKPAGRPLPKALQKVPPRRKPIGRITTNKE